VKAIDEFTCDVAWSCLEGCHAYEQLRDPETGGRWTAEEMLEKLKLCGYSEEVAQKAARERANRRLDLGLSP
jgi:hypothetical protein